MIHRFIGRAGSGKSTYWLDALKSEYHRGAECIVIVPEQQSIDMEKRLSLELGNRFNINVEILNFERLPNRIRREYGGMNKKHLDRATEALLFALATQEAAGELKEYAKSVTDNDFIKRVAYTVSALKKDGFDTEKLKNVVSSVGTGYEKRLAAKLNDISHVYQAYETLTEKDFSSAADELSVLASDLPEMPFFCGKSVFIDGYYIFTEVEYAILAQIIKTADEVYLTCLYSEADAKLFEPTSATLKRTQAYAGGVCDDIILEGNKRASSPALLHIDENLRRTVNKKISSSDSVELYACGDIYNESIFVASLIAKLVSEGYRYKDITVAVRNTESYSGILDVILEKYGIPVYSGNKDRLSSKSLSAFILSCIDIACSNYASFSVERYIKCGYSDLSERETRDLLSYMNTWNIRGKQWYGEDWAMNPDGYCTSLDGAGEKMLAAVNAARRKLIDPLAPLIETLRAPDLTVGNAVEAIYSHFVELDIAGKLSARARLLSDARLNEDAALLSLMYETLIKILETLYNVCGDMRVTPKRLGQLFSLMADGYSLGSIPSVVDRVNIGSASLIRPQNCKVMIAVGVNDGVFPASPSEDGLFGERERNILEKLGITVEKPSKTVISEEWLTFYTVCTYPSEKLIITYCAADMSGAALRPSQGVLRVQALFDDAEIKVPSEKDICMSKNIAIDMLPALTDKKLKNHLETLISYKYEKKKPFHDTEARIESRTLSGVFLSASRLQTYNLCPFSYYGKYILSLKEETKAKIASLEIGRFIHTILERFVRDRFAAGSFARIEGKALEAEADRLVNEYASTLFSGMPTVPARSLHSLTRLKRSICYLFSNIVTEFDGSDFVPLGYELPITGAAGKFAEFETEGRPKVLMSGYIDRVDRYVSADGIEYIKIVDYKSSKKNIALQFVEDGIDLQMLAYMDSFIRYSSNRSEQLQPAAALYMPVILKDVEAGSSQSKITSEFKRRGLISDNSEVINAFGASGKTILPSSTHPSSRESYISEEKFREIRNKVNDVITMTGSHISKGFMDIKPYKKDINSHNPCQNCIVRSMCRKGAAEWIV